MAPYNKAPESGTRNGRPTAGRGPGAGALVGGALFVGLIALCALVISYNGIFQFAEYGGHEGSPLAHVFPVTYTLLLIMACWVSYMLRGAHPRERLWVDLVLIPALILVSAAAMLLSNLELVERVHQGVANVIVAVAPLAALLVAFLLWMALRAHMRRRRRARLARPRPADDPTTVLHARSAASPAPSLHTPADEGNTLKARLLRLGSEEPDEADRERATPDEETGSEAPDESAEREAPVAAEPLPAPRVEPDPGEAEEDEFASSVPTLPLPRRSRSGDNPIRRAVEQTPVVPGAAAPEPEPDPVPEVADHLADEGFDHQPPQGDPSSDEAEAPLAATAPDPVPATGEEPAREADTHQEPDALPDTWNGDPEPEPGVLDDASEETDTPSSAHWEPPEDDTGPHILADYVPPVWTPPEDDPPAFPREPGGPETDEEPESTPALDHDTGPSVRAAFRFGDVPPGAARPSDEPVVGAAQDSREGDGEASERPREPDPSASGGGDLPPEPEELPSDEPDPEPEHGDEPDSSDGTGERPRFSSSPVEKRPMVLKPPRPPMPDFAAGPPSRRVRSEPLRPED